MTLYYILDPMCSWCYGFRTVFDQLRAKLPENITIDYVMGGLAPDNDEPMPEETQQYVQSQWKLVEQQTAATFNWNFWAECKPRRSTYPACRAVIAAGQQGKEYRLPMIHAIQDAYYQRALNPSDRSTLIQMAEEINQDKTEFETSLTSAETEQQLQDNFKLRQQLGVNSFPSICLVHNDKVFQLKHSYINAENLLKQIQTIITA